VAILFWGRSISWGCRFFKDRHRFAIGVLDRREI